MASAVISSWQELPAAGGLRLRCWWARPAQQRPRAAVLVLPEVFGLNAWVRGVAERLAAEGYGALAMPIFARTAPDLDLGYDAAGLAAGRVHRDRVSAADVLADARAAIAWLQAQPGLDGPVGCVGFCFGGHLAMLAATIPEVAASCAAYGARVSSFRPGGGEPTLAVLPTIPGHLLCLVGDQDPLMPAEERQAIAAALATDAARRPQLERRLVVAPGAGHGFFCEARADYHPEAAAQGWQEMLALFSRRL
ncbi:dienelactone hydrolase family protein [Cyanobium sp. ATX 6A2]|jgi:carboxymethylenebutenolidase|uniref:dienelactone hydrolase family protein n=1 Tax=Cyanobium sp. ATX 6A2 TaxID=2823700 RepID=UPI0020CB7688|nr:dienelactone hydrolase family protein [Cyanobium sp. ATX 6A2]MCP9887011.1 dienelactone hydrolase family protein [Cyanobium sp. ATX 6A2]